MLLESWDCNFPTKQREKKELNIMFAASTQAWLKTLSTLFPSLHSSRGLGQAGLVAPQSISQCQQPGREMPTCLHLPRPLTSLCTARSTLSFQNLGNLVKIKISYSHFLTSKSRKIILFPGRTWFVKL